MEQFDLDGAVRAGVIRSDQADALRRFDEAQRHAPGATEERFAFVSGFADVMAAVGILMVTITIGVMLGSTFPPAYAIFPLACWWAARYFTEKRKLMLCSFIIFLLFALTSAGAGLVLSAFVFGTNLSGGPGDLPALGSIAAATTAAAACYAWWRRFTLPIAYASFAVAVLNICVNLLRALLPNFPSLGVDLVSAACGPAMFVWAMWWDMSDVRRETVRSDVAFWLHVAAGFLLVKGAMTLLLGVHGDAASWGRMFKSISDPTRGQAISVLLLFMVFATIALIIDRRSLLTSGMFYAVPAMISLFGGMGSSAVAWAFLLCGLTLTFLAVRWTSIRERLLPLLPDKLSAQMPRPQFKAVGPRPVY
jgi:hypothetical protein